LTFGSRVQLWLHAPQFVGSDFKSTHFVSQRSGEGDAQLDEHAGVAAVIEQSPVGAAQDCPHFPQFACVLRSVSQPSSERTEQCPKPGVQALGGT
jgi:hypothetical protein